MLARTPADFAFAPDQKRAASLDVIVRNRLADSLAESLAACIGHLRWNEYEAARLIDEIRGQKVRAAVMAIYADFVEALFQDDLTAAQNFLDELFAVRRGVTRRLCTLDDATLGAGQAARYHRLISDDPAITISLHPFNQDELAEAAPVFDAAFALLREGAPELAAEMDVLLREIVLLEGRKPDDDAAELGGASTFYLWGAAFINFSKLPDRLALVEALTHEAAHLLLFGLTLGKPLVTNGAQERFASPLRDDPRPMDGIVHAAYVLARIAWCMEQILQAGLLSPDETVAALAAQARCRRDFATALQIIDAHAHFTPAGRAAFAPAAEWVGLLER